MMGQLFSFQGRTTRLGYLAVGFVQLIAIVALVIVFAVMVASGIKGHNIMMVAIGGLVLLGGGIMTAWMGFAVIARRLRDMGAPVSLGMSAIVILNLVAGFNSAGTMQAAMSGHMPTATAGSSLLSLISACVGLALLFWPSAKDKTDMDLDEIFGREEEPEPAFQTPMTPSFSAPPPPARPATPRLAGGQMAARTTFGLRGVS